MKILLYITALFIGGCNKPYPKEVIELKKDSIVVDTAMELKPLSTLNHYKYYTKEDSVIISTNYGDTLSYSKKEYNDIVEYFPSLHKEYPDPPDIAYNSGRNFVDVFDSAGNKNHISFGSECGQDNYYLFYAFFLKKKNGETKYAERRKNLILIYNEINSIYDALQYGGTYFVHQQRRIIGYAEYAIYWYSERKEFFDKSCDISNQKKLFINSLKQKISDEEDIDNNFLKQSDKEKRKQELYKLANHIGELITDNFYLKMAQEFQYKHY